MTFWKFRSIENPAHRYWQKPCPCELQVSQLPRQLRQASNRPSWCSTVQSARFYHPYCTL